MEKISEFLIEHWIILLAINILAIIFIIGYLFEQRDSKKNKRLKPKNNDNNIIFDNETPIINNKDTTLENKNSVNIKNNFKNVKNINNDKKIDEQVNILEKNANKEKKDQYIKTIDNETKKQIHDNIEYIINQSNSVFEEFDKVIPKKKIIEDEVKEKLELHEEELKPSFDNHKKNIDIDTNIELPEIDIETEDEDIWN